MTLNFRGAEAIHIIRNGFGCGIPISCSRGIGWYRSHPNIREKLIDLYSFLPFLRVCSVVYARFSEPGRGEAEQGQGLGDYRVAGAHHGRHPTLCEREIIGGDCVCQIHWFATMAMFFFST